MTTDNGIQNLTGVILAGGRGRRMDGKDKGLVEFRGRPLIEHVIDLILPQVDTLLINANRNIPDYERYGYPVIPDVLPDYQGPLAGMLSGLQKASTDRVLFVPCDVPDLPADLARRLVAAMGHQNADVCIPNDSERNHAVIALMKRSLQDSMQDWLASGERKVENWVLAQNYTAVDFSDCCRCFHNLNRTPDLSG